MSLVRVAQSLCRQLPLGPFPSSILRFLKIRRLKQYFSSAKSRRTNRLALTTRDSISRQRVLVPSGSSSNSFAGAALCSKDKVGRQSKTVPPRKKAAVASRRLSFDGESEGRLPPLRNCLPPFPQSHAREFSLASFSQFTHAPFHQLLFS